MIDDHDASSTDSRDTSNSTSADSGVAMEDGHSVTSAPKRAPFPYENAKAEPNNPSVIPRAILEKFHFTFLIRHPRSSIPSYYRCTIPPLVGRTGFPYFMPEEAGYDELRRMFDYLKDTGLVGPQICGRDNEESSSSSSSGVEICLIDADDMLDNPEGIMRKYCESVGLDFQKEMLTWNTEEAHEFAKEQFEKWTGFHDDAINSKDLKPRQHVSRGRFSCS